MNYGLMKVNTTDSSYEIFSTTVGAVYTYDNSKLYINPSSSGTGFPVVAQAAADFTAVQNGDTYVIVSYDDSQLDPNSFSIGLTSCTVVYATTTDDSTMKSYFDFSTMDQNNICSWAVLIGDKDYLSQFITDERFYVNWVKYINPTDHDSFMAKITTEECFAEWGVEIGDLDFCRPHIIDDPYVYYWALNIPLERPNMKVRITTALYQSIWNQQFPFDQITVLASPTPTVTTSVTATPDVTPTPSVTQTPSA